MKKQDWGKIKDWYSIYFSHIRVLTKWGREQCCGDPDGLTDFECEVEWLENE